MANTFSGYAWECVCGNIEYGDNAPESCAQCSALDSFEKADGSEDSKDLAEDLE